MQDESEADVAARHFRGIEVPRPIRLAILHHRRPGIRRRPCDRRRIKNYGVSAWAIEDLRCSKSARRRSRSAPRSSRHRGRRSRRTAWSRNHGGAKRAAVVCDVLLEAGSNAQAGAADFHAPADAPLLTEDAGMLLVDVYLRSHGSHVACTREEIRQAFAYLTNPRVGMAAHVDAAHLAIVPLHAPIA
jgi:hypothetical protein